MNSQQYKKAARLFKSTWKDLEKEAIKDGVSPLSEDFKLVQDKIREQILERAGFSAEEYKEAEAVHLKDVR